MRDGLLNIVMVLVLGELLGDVGECRGGWGCSGVDQRSLLYVPGIKTSMRQSRRYRLALAVMVGLNGGPDVQVSSCMLVECGRSQMNLICRLLGQVFW